MSRVRELTNADLSIKDVPAIGAGWNVIRGFALSFQPDDPHFFDKQAAMANQSADAFVVDGSLPHSLTDLRTCLAFEQRRWSYFGLAPDASSMQYVHALVKEIRTKVIMHALE